MAEIVFHPNRAGDQDDPTRHSEFFRACCREGRTEGWTCKKTAAAGDLSLFWFSTPSLMIAGAGICKGDVDPAGKDGSIAPRHWMCSFEPLKELQRPITLDHIQRDQVLADWWKGRPFQGSPKRISDNAAACLMTLILRLNPSLDSLHREFPIPAPVDVVTIPNDDDSPPSTVIYTGVRKARDTEKVVRLKRLYKYACQVCGYCIRIPRTTGGEYAEVHHLRPLGGEHQGLDNWDNMLVLCPPCHVEFDRLAMAVNPKTGRIACFDKRNPKMGRKPLCLGKHKLAAVNIDHHWRRYCSLFSGNGI